MKHYKTISRLIESQEALEKLYDARIAKEQEGKSGNLIEDADALFCLNTELNIRRDMIKTFKSLTLTEIGYEHSKQSVYACSKYEVQFENKAELNRVCASHRGHIEEIEKYIKKAKLNG